MHTPNQAPNPFHETLWSLFQQLAKEDTGVEGVRFADEEIVVEDRDGNWLYRGKARDIGREKGGLLYRQVTYSRTIKSLPVVTIDPSVVYNEDKQEFEIQ